MKPLLNRNRILSNDILLIGNCWTLRVTPTCENSTLGFRFVLLPD